MWNYEKRLQYPIRIKNPDARAAKIIITQYGGPKGKKRWISAPAVRSIPLRGSPAKAATQAKRSPPDLPPGQWARWSHPFA